MPRTTKSGKYSNLADHQYADMYDLQMKDEYDDDGNRNDNDHLNRAMIKNHQTQNYDLRRTHEMLQDDDFRRHMKDQGLKGIDRMVKRESLPGSALIMAMKDYGAKQGTHNNRGEFGVNDLAGSFRALATENQKFLQNRAEGMMDDKLKGMEDNQNEEQASEPTELSNTAKEALGFDQETEFGADTGARADRLMGASADPENAAQDNQMSYDPNRGIKGNQSGNFMNNFKANLKSRTRMTGRGTATLK